jgi:ADP-heptose:LPS heptosyltransferase
MKIVHKGLIKMKHIFLLQAFGDNVISLHNIEKYKKQGEFKIYGTNLTEDIKKILEFNIDTIKIFNEIPSFYNIRKDGFLEAIKDFYKLIIFIKISIPIHSELIFEKDDFRFRLIKLCLPSYKLIAPKVDRNVYTDRAKTILSKNSLDIFISSSHTDIKQSILINPTGRNEKRYLSKNVIFGVLNELNERDIEVHFVDYLGVYSYIQNDVSFYYKNTKLYEAVNILKKVDLYCGPDSLFIHLAYVFQKKYFCIMNYDSSYFMPPNTNENSYILKNRDNFNEMGESFSKWIEG